MYITALDLGSSQIRAIVAEVKKEGQLAIFGVFKIFSAGIRKGEIVDLEETTEALRGIFLKIKEIDNAAIKNIFVNVGGAGVKCQTSRGIVAVSRADNEISQDDIDRVIKASQAIKLLPNRMIIHTLAKEFVIDGISDIREPLAMTGTRLEVNSLIIDASSPNVKNIINCVESLGGKIGGLIYNPLSGGRSVLTKVQKDLGAVLIDIGSGTTSMSVYEEGKFIHAAAFPVGSGNITNDLAIGLKCSVKAAELIKILFGTALSRDVSIKEKISQSIIKEKSGVDVRELDKNFKTIFSRRFVAEIIESRLSEIFEFINNELKLIDRSRQLPAGAVIVGGGAKIPALVELAKQELKLSAEIGMPEIQNLEFYNAEFGGQVESPDFSAVAGLLLWGSDEHSGEKNWTISKKGLKGLVFKMLKYFKP